MENELQEIRREVRSLKFKLWDTDHRDTLINIEERLANLIDIVRERDDDE